MRPVADDGSHGVETDRRGIVRHDDFEALPIDRLAMKERQTLIEVFEILVVGDDDRDLHRLAVCRR